MLELELLSNLASHHSHHTPHVTWSPNIIISTDKYNDTQAFFIFSTSFGLQIVVK